MYCAQKYIVFNDFKSDLYEAKSPRGRLSFQHCCIVIYRFSPFRSFTTIHFRQNPLFMSSFYFTSFCKACGCREKTKQQFKIDLRSFMLWFQY